MSTETSERETSENETSEKEASERKLGSDELGALEEQRDFLLRSLADLDREHAAGDVDEHDYQALRDDYTKRAARVMRLIEAQTVRAAKTASRPTPWRKIAVGAGVAVFALVAGLLMAQASGRREAGDTMTGDVSQSNQVKLDQALALASEGQYDEAIDLHDEVLEDDPDNVEAMTYKGWFQALGGDPADGLATLSEAAQIDPDYPDTHAFLAVLLARRFGRPDLALQELDRLDRLDPPADIRLLTDNLRADLEASTTTSTPPPP